MFRARPLTWLFIAATVCIDVAWVVMIRDRDLASWRHLSQLLLYGGVGLIFAQSCTSAMVVVSRVREKLTQASILTVGNGLLAWLVYLTGLLNFERWFIYFILHGVQAITVATLWQLARHRRESVPRTTVWRVSVMEILGWTVVVAILSFGLRYVEFSKIRLLGCAAFLVPSLLLTLEANWGHGSLSKATVGLRITRIVGVALVSIVLFYFATIGYGLVQGAGLFGAYALYLCIWTVLDGTELKNEGVLQKVT